MHDLFENYVLISHLTSTRSSSSAGVDIEMFDIDIYIEVSELLLSNFLFVKFKFINIMCTNLFEFVYEFD